MFNSLTLLIILGLSHLFIGSALAYPACAQVCLDRYLNTGPCSVLDGICQCTNNDFLRDVGSCVCEFCSSREIQLAAVEATEICRTQGITLQIVSCSSLSSTSPLRATTVTVTSQSAPTGQVSGDPVVAVCGVANAIAVAAGAVVALVF